MSDESLHQAYEATDFWVEDAPAGAFCFRCGQPSADVDRLLDASGLEVWAYITACNPGSHPLRHEENARRMQLLEERLRRLPTLVYHGKGIGTVGNWPAEPSLLILGITESQALEIAAEFGQKAIVVGRHGEPARLAWVTP